MSGAEYGFDAAVMNVRLGKRDVASKILWEVLRKDNRHALAWDLRARLEADEGRHENALLHQGFAIQAAPHRFDLWHNKGMIEASLHDFKAAEKSFAKAVELQESFESHFNWGNVLCNQMRIEEAVKHYERALELDTTNNAQLLVNYGEALMSLGDWRAGFQNYRHRFNAPGFPPAPRHRYPLWHGENLDEKNILLFVEQGFGDEILSLRFAQCIRDKYPTACVTIAVRPPMYRLARIADGIADMVTLLYDDPGINIDYTCALLDVPAWLELSPETVPGKAGYLKAEDRGFGLGMPDGFNIGICWASGKRELQPHVADTARAKSLTFQQMTSIFEGLDVNLFSLQQTHTDDKAMRDLGMRDPMPGVTDFADTAFIMDHLDLIITVDTSVAHLAGAMGKPCWNLVRADALWPWMQQTSQTCWYDSMTLYRQTALHHWAEPLKRIRDDLVELLDRRAAA